MTVKELIEILQRMPKDAQVYKNTVSMNHVDHNVNEEVKKVHDFGNHNVIIY